MRGKLRSLVCAVLVCTLAAIPVPVGSSVASSYPPPIDVRLTADFGQGGVVRLQGWTAVLHTVELSDSRLLVRVQHKASSGVVDLDGIVRLLPSGALDPSWGSAGPTPGTVVLPSSTGTTIHVRAAGEVVFGDGVVRQLTADGVVDATFASGGTFNMTSGPVIELDDGTLLITILNSVSSGGLGLMHLDSSGVALPEGVNFTHLTAGRMDVLRASDGSWLLVAAGRSDGNGELVHTEARVIALTPTGVVDTSYGDGDGVVTLGVQSAVASLGPAVMGALMPNQQLVVGVKTWGGYQLVRLTAAGALDGTFGTGGREVRPWQRFGGDLMSVEVDDDGAMTLGVTYRFDHPPNPYLSTVVRTLPSGDVDSNFRRQGWTPGSAWLSEVGVPGFSIGGTVTAVLGGSVIVATTQFDPTLSATGVAQLVKLQLPPRTRITAVVAPAQAFAPAVRLMNAHRP